MQTIAERTDIRINCLLFEGLLLDSNEYAIAFDQLQVTRLIEPSCSITQPEDLLGATIRTQTVEVSPTKATEVLLVADSLDVLLRLLP